MPATIFPRTQRDSVSAYQKCRWAAVLCYLLGILLVVTAWRLLGQDCKSWVKSFASPAALGLLVAFLLEVVVVSNIYVARAFSLRRARRFFAAVFVAGVASEYFLTWQTAAAVSSSDDLVQSWSRLLALSIVMFAAMLAIYVLFPRVVRGGLPSDFNPAACDTRTHLPKSVMLSLTVSVIATCALGCFSLAIMNSPAFVTSAASHQLDDGRKVTCSYNVALLARHQEYESENGEETYYEFDYDGDRKWVGYIGKTPEGTVKSVASEEYDSLSKRREAIREHGYKAKAVFLRNGYTARTTYLSKARGKKCITDNCYSIEGSCNVLTDSVSYSLKGTRIIETCEYLRPSRYGEHPLVEKYRDGNGKLEYTAICSYDDTWKVACSAWVRPDGSLLSISTSDGKHDYEAAWSGFKLGSPAHMDESDLLDYLTKNTSASKKDLSKITYSD